MATELGVKNAALRHLGQPALATLTDDIESRYVLDGVWDDAIVFVLRQAPWRFALKTAAQTGATSSLIVGYTHSVARPADWLRTHSIYKLVGAKEYPIDFKEHALRWFTNGASFNARFVSTDYNTPSSWTEQFAKALSAYVAFLSCDKITGDPSRTAKTHDLFQEFLQGAIDSDTVQEDPWLEHQMDGSFLSAARSMLEKAFWNFALKTATPSTSGSAVAGFTNSYPKPADWLRTHAIYKLSGSKEYPLDVREQGGFWSTNEAIKVRYISTDALDSTLWPEEFLRVVGSFLGIDFGDSGWPLGSNTVRVGADSKLEAKSSRQLLWPNYFETAAASIAVPENPWLMHQLDGSFITAAQAMLSKAFWNFALKTFTPSSSGTAVPGFSTAYPKPADWLRTHAIFKLSGSKECPLDVREQGVSWSANEAIKVRYLTSTALDSTLWPEEFFRLVAAYLGINYGDEGSVQGKDGSAQSPMLWPDYLASAIKSIAVPENPWLTYQLDGSLLPAVNYLLEEGLWKFAIVTASLTPNVATPSAGYTYAFDKPAAWIRTVEVYYTQGIGIPAGHLNIDYRDEGNDFHANYTPIVLRYLSSTLGRDSTAWSDAFMATLLAYLPLKRLTDMPGTPGAVLQARQAAYERAFENARSKDDSRERPRVLQASRLTAARIGGSTSYRREQGW